jgi:acylphosphatase
MQPLIRHLRIVGRVQGVGYRYGMQRKAAQLEVQGWVRNLRDGSVEAMISGSPEAVAQMIAWARHGPRNAEVDRVEVAPGEGDFVAFETRASE